MRQLTIISLAYLLLASPAAAQTFSVPQCEEQAAETDAAVQKFLKLPQAEQDADADADTAEAINDFSSFCVKPYACPAFEKQWEKEQDTERFGGEPDYFAKLFAAIKTNCGRK